MSTGLPRRALGDPENSASPRPIPIGVPTETSVRGKPRVLVPFLCGDSARHVEYNRNSVLINTVNPENILNMGIIQSAYRVFSEEGTIPLVRRSSVFLKRRVTQQLADPIFKLITPDKIKFSVDDIEAIFDMSIVTTNVDFRHDFHSEKSVISSFIDDIEQDDIVYDIGANVGIYSSFVGQIVDDGMVICIEPHPIAVPVLYQNLSTNCSEFEVVQVAVSNKKGYGKMQPDFSTDANIKTKSGINIKLEKMADIIEQNSFPSPTVSKIDVEGAELDVLNGFEHVLDELELLYVEVHHMRGEKFNSDKNTIINLLEDSFDSVIELEQHDRGGGTQTHIKATSR